MSAPVFAVPGLGLLAGVLVLLALAAPAAADEGQGRVVVSFTFTGGYAGQDAAAEVLSRHGVAGTFYVSSRFVGRADFMDLADLRGIAATGSEIGGDTVSHRDLSELSDDVVRSEVCNNRAQLGEWGFPVTSFAYPHGTWTFSGQQAVEDCGYLSGRGIAELRVSDEHCSACPAAESRPPLNPYALRTTSPGASVAEIEQVVTHAQREGGGWVPIALRHVCVCSRDDAISPRELDALVSWMVDRAPDVEVRTVGEVVGGAVLPVVRVPDPEATRTISPREAQVTPLSRRPAWTLLGVRVGQVQILTVGLLAALVVVVGYRTGTRGSRYGR